MILETIPTGPLEVNCYLIGCENSRHIFVVDPGDDADRIITMIANLRLIPQAVIATHGHLDHLGDIKTVQERFNIPFWIHSDDAPLVAALPAQATAFGLHLSGIPVIDRHLEHDQFLPLGDMEWRIIHTPGHSPGSICLQSDLTLLSGDTLFAGSVGRCDLPGGDWTRLQESIRTRLLTLDESTVVYPGHGTSTTIGAEKSDNPFL